MKYVLTNERKEIVVHIDPNTDQKVVLYRIVALRDFKTVALVRKVKYEDGKAIFFYQREEIEIKSGQKGGYVQSMKNLSQDGSCWIDKKAAAFGNSSVEDESYLGDHAAIGDHVKLRDNTKVIDFVQLGGEITLCGNSIVIGPNAYFDKGVYKDLFLGKDIAQTSSQKNTKKPPEKSPKDSLGGKIKIECQVDGKKIVNDFEF